jgi:hypothetical protein
MFLSGSCYWNLEESYWINEYTIQITILIDFFRALRPLTILFAGLIKGYIPTSYRRMLQKNPFIHVGIAPYLPRWHYSVES